MADDRGNISQRLSLDGDSEIVQKFNTLAEAGERTAERIRQGFERVSGGFERAFEPLRNLGERFVQIGEVFGVGLGVGAGGAVAGILEIVKSSAEAIHNMENLAAQTGTTIEEMSGITSAFAAFGVNTDDLGTAFKRLAVRVETEWGTIQKSIHDAASTVARDSLNIQSAFDGVAKAEEKLVDVIRTNARQQITDLLGVRGASLSLAEAQYKLAVAEGRAEKDPQFEKALEIDRLRLEIAEKRQKLADATQKVEDDARQAPLKRQEAELAVSKAQLAQDEAQKKASDDQANSIGTLTDYVDRLAAAGKRASDAMKFGVEIQTPAPSTAGVNVTLDNMIKGIIASAGQATEQVGELKGGLVGLADTGPTLLPVVLKLADVFKGTGNEALNMALAVKLFGRGVSVDMVRALSQGSGAILEQKERLKSLGLTYTEEEAHQAVAFNRSKNTLVDYIGIIKDKVGVAFAPAATQLFDALRDQLVANFGSIKDAAESMAESATAAVQALINIMKGVSFEDFAKDAHLSPEQLLKVQEWQKSFEHIAGYAAKALTGIKDAGLALGGIWAGLTKAADIALAPINAIFQTHLSGVEAIFGVWIFKIVGGFQLVRGVVAILSGAFAGLSGAVGALVGLGLAGWAIGAAAALGLLLAATHPGPAGALKNIQEHQSDQNQQSPQQWAWIDQMWESMKEKAAAAWNYVKSLFSGSGTGASGLSGDFLRGSFTVAWDGLKQDAAAAWDAIKDKIAAVMADIGNSIADAPREAILRGWQSIRDGIIGIIQTIPDGIRAAMNAIPDILVSPFTAALAKIEGIIARIKSLLSFGSSASDKLATDAGINDIGKGGGEDGGREFASGGRPPSNVPSLVGERGPELFIPDHAGTILPNSLTEALAGAGGMLRDAIESMAQSMASMRVPTLAAAGASGSAGAGLHPVTINLPGGQSVSGIYGTPSAIDDLRQMSVLKQSRLIGGKAQSWVR